MTDMTIRREAARTRRRWRRWLTCMEREIGWLCSDRRMHKRVLLTLENNEHIGPGTEFSDWVVYAYTVEMAATIRRLMECKQSTKYWPISLGNLVKDICCHSELVDRKWFVRPYPKVLRQLGIADRDFSALTVKDGVCLSPSYLCRRLKQAERETHVVTAYVDKMVAHHDRKPPSVIPTYRHMDQAIEAVYSLFATVYLLLERTHQPCYGEDGLYWDRRTEEVLRRFKPSTPLMYWDHEGNEVIIDY